MAHCSIGTMVDIVPTVGKLLAHRRQRLLRLRRLIVQKKKTDNNLNLILIIAKN